MHRACSLDRSRIAVEPHSDANFADKLEALGHNVVTREEIPADWMLPFTTSCDPSREAPRPFPLMAKACVAPPILVLMASL